MSECEPVMRPRQTQVGTFPRHVVVSTSRPLTPVSLVANLLTTRDSHGQRFALTIDEGNFVPYFRISLACSGSPNQPFLQKIVLEYATFACWSPTDFLVFLQFWRLPSCPLTLGGRHIQRVDRRRDSNHESPFQRACTVISWCRQCEWGSKLLADSCGYFLRFTW